MFRVCGKNWKGYENDSDSTDEDSPDSTNAQDSQTRGNSSLQPLHNYQVAPLSSIATSSIMTAMSGSGGPCSASNIRRIAMRRDLSDIKEILHLPRPPRPTVDNRVFNPVMFLSSEVSRNCNELRYSHAPVSGHRSLEHPRPPRLECPEPIRPCLEGLNICPQTDAVEPRARIRININPGTGGEHERIRSEEGRTEASVTATQPKPRPDVLDVGQHGDERSVIRARSQDEVLEETSRRVGSDLTRSISTAERSRMDIPGPTYVESGRISCYNPSCMEPEPSRIRIEVPTSGHTVVVESELNMECPSRPTAGNSFREPEAGPSNAIDVEDLTRTAGRTPPAPSIMIKRKSPKRNMEKRAKLLKKPRLKRDADPLSVQFAFEEVIIVDEVDNSSLERPTGARIDQSEQPKSTAVPKTSEDKFVELNRTLLKILECPVCLDVMQPPIQNCKRGHLVCKMCRVRLESCPYCRARLCETRNLAMEQVAESILYPCEYHTVGCGAQVLLRDKPEHESNCQHKIYNCCFDICMWKGQYKEIMPHIEETHSNRILVGSKHDLVIASIEALSINWIIRVYDQVFHLNMAFCNDFNLCIRHIGPVRDAAKYFYITNIAQEPASLKREVRYTRNVHNYNDRIHVLNGTGESFYMRANTVKLFMHEGFLKCNVEIREI